MDDNGITRSILVEYGSNGEQALRMQVLRISRLLLSSAYIYPPHEHFVGEIILPGDMTYECVLNDTPLRVKPGQLLLVQPTDIHSDNCRESGSVTFLIFSAVDLFGVPWRGERILVPGGDMGERIMPIAEDGELARLLPLMSPECIEPEPLEMQRMREKIAEAFLWRLIAGLPRDRLLPNFVAAVEQESFQDRVLRYFQEHMAQTLSVQNMAAAFGVSKRTLEHRFRKTFGSSPARAFTEYRIRIAAQMLKRGDYVYAVSQRLGFSDPFYFSTVFKRIMGCPPSKAV